AFTKNSKRSRESTSLILGIVLFIVAIPSALSSSILENFSIFGLSVFDATDYFVSNILLQLGALMIALFIIHKMDNSLVNIFFIFWLSVFDSTDYFVSNILLRLGALMIALFIIHKMDKSLVKSEFMLGNELPSVFYSIWRFLMTIVLPLVILFVYLNLLGII